MTWTRIGEGGVPPGPGGGGGLPPGPEGGAGEGPGGVTSGGG
jgi:hypothetical protein